VETAEIAIQAAMTATSSFSTLHTNDAASAVTRLVDMGIERSWSLRSSGRLSPASPASPLLRMQGRIHSGG